MIKDLIKIKSKSGMEQEIGGYITSLLTGYGLKIVNVNGSLLLKISGQDKNKCIVFNAHIDTVSEGSLKDWKYDPYSGAVSGNKIFGVGASDNKASVATLLKLAKLYSEIIPMTDILMMFTTCEEVDGSGTENVFKYCLENKLLIYKNIAGVVCEPTGLKEIGIAHMGNAFIKVVTSGKSGHGSVPIDSKDNAVFKMFEVAKKINILQEKWKVKYKNKILGLPTIGILTSIHAGDVVTPNKFSDKCEASFDIRTTPGMHSQVLDNVKKVVGRLGTVEYIYPPLYFANTNVDSDIVKIAKSITKVKAVSFKGSSDMCFFTANNIPCIIYGPGEADVMHKPNEYCYIDKIDKCVEIFNNIVEEFARII